MQRQLAIRRFVQETLGCTCPDEVFDTIDDAVDPAVSWIRRIDIGNRLLIYLIDGDSAPDLPGRIPELLAKGVAERDSRGFNRFRLVLATERPDDLRLTAEPAFDGSTDHDEKTHLHILDKGALADLQ